MKEIWERFSVHERIAAGGAVVVAISLFLPWYGYSFLGYSASIDGFHSYGLLAALGVVVLVFGLVAEARGVKLPARAAIGRRSNLAGGILMVVGSLLFLLAYHQSSSSSTVLFSYGPETGVYLAILGSVLALFGVVSAGRSGAAG